MAFGALMLNAGNKLVSEVFPLFSFREREDAQPCYRNNVPDERRSDLHLFPWHWCTAELQGYSKKIGYQQRRQQELALKVAKFRQMQHTASVSSQPSSIGMVSCEDAGQVVGCHPESLKRHLDAGSDNPVLDITQYDIVRHAGMSIMTCCATGHTSETSCCQHTPGGTRTESWGGTGGGHINNWTYDT